MSPEQENPEGNGPLADLRGRGDGLKSPPPAYFDALADRALAATEQPAAVRRLPLRWLAAAATVVLLLVAAFLLRPGANGEVAENPATTPPPASAEMLLANLDPDDIDAYIADELDEYETELLNFNFNPDEDYK